MRQHGAAAVMTVLAGLCASPRAEQIGAVSATVTVLAPTITEAKLYKLLPGFDHRDAFEASGVQYRDGFFYVVFDNRYEIARIAAELPTTARPTPSRAYPAPAPASRGSPGTPTAPKTSTS